eukprot:COSAG02_NODE_1557_length_11939_cov_343.602872_3_plen_89_part_00
MRLYNVETYTSNLAFRSLSTLPPMLRPCYREGFTYQRKKETIHAIATLYLPLSLVALNWRDARVIYVTGGRMEGGETHRDIDVELHTK